jgi:hypothetical protein
VKQHCKTDLSREIPSKDGPRADTAIADFCPSLERLTTAATTTEERVESSFLWKVWAALSFKKEKQGQKVQRHLQSA